MATFRNITCTSSGSTGTVAWPPVLNLGSTYLDTNARMISPAIIAGSLSFSTILQSSATSSNKTVTFQDVTGTVYVSGGTDVAVADGGTNISSYAVGDLLYASGSTTLAKLADVATGNALISGGVGAAPSWGKITTSHTTGIAASGTNTDITSLNGLASGGTIKFNTSDFILTNSSTALNMTGSAFALCDGSRGIKFAVDNTSGGRAICYMDPYATSASAIGTGLDYAYFSMTNTTFELSNEKAGGIFIFYTGGGTERIRINDSTTNTLTVTGGLSVTLNVALGKTITAAATTGAQTINKTTGSVNFAAAATSLVVTNSLVSTSSVIICTVGTNDTTLKSVSAVAAAGSFTMYANAAATAETRVNFIVTN